MNESAVNGVTEKQRKREKKGGGRELRKIVKENASRTI